MQNLQFLSALNKMLSFNLNKKNNSYFLLMFFLSSFFSIMSQTNLHAQENPLNSLFNKFSNNSSPKLKYKQYSCKTLDQALACSSACEYTSDVDFRISVENNYVIRKQANSGWDKFGTSIKNLGDCAVWDQKNWTCEERDPHPIHYVYHMIDGTFFSYLLGQNSNVYYCAK